MEFSMKLKWSATCSIPERDEWEWHGDEGRNHEIITTASYWSIFMKVVCAWCQREGKPGLIREIPPIVDQRVTHGICTTHSEVYYARLRAGLKRVHPIEGQLRSDPAAVG
jgi:hypothetical protein